MSFDGHGPRIFFGCMVAQLWANRMSDPELQPVTADQTSPGTVLGKTLLALNNQHARVL
jgi:hypothetical protein